MSADKIHYGLEDFRYGERLDRLGSFTTKQRRLKHDLKEKYKIMRGFYKTDGQNHFPMVRELKRRGHGLNAIGRNFQVISGVSLFTQRVVDIWNMLPEVVVESDTITIQHYQTIK